MFSKLNSPFLRSNVHCSTNEFEERVQTVPDALTSCRRSVVAISTDCLRVHSRISRPLAWCEHAYYDTGTSQASSENGGKTLRISASALT